MCRIADRLRTVGRVERQARGGLWVPLAATVLVAIGAMPAAGQLRGPEVENVRFEGNHTFPGDSLARAIVTQETSCRSRVLFPFCGLGIEFAIRRSQLRERELPRDQARLMIWYQRRGFLQVRVDAPVVTRRAATADVLYTIVEGEPVIADSITFVGAEGFEATGLLDNLPLERGDRLSALRLDATRDSLTRRLSNQGYAYADVFRQALRPASDPNRARVTFEIVPGPATTYGQINVSGLENLSLGTVRRTVRFSDGDMYRSADIDEAIGRLYGLEIVRSANVTPVLGLDPDPVVDIDVVVQEGDAYRVRAGGGWSTAECLNLESRWASRNFLGGARLLQVRGRVGNLLAPQFRDVLCSQSGVGPYASLTWLAAVDLVQPWVFSTANSLTASVFAERQSLPDVFIRRAVGFQLSLTRSVSPQTFLTGFYRPELSQLAADGVLFCSGFLVCTPDDVAALEGANWLSPVGLNLRRDRSDDLLNPRHGYRLLFDLEHAAPWTASDFRYDRVVGEAIRYTSVAGGVVLAARVRGGWVGSGVFEDLVGASQSVELTHPQKRFYSGGANSVRGFAQSRLGPRVLFATADELLTSTINAGAGCVPSQIVDVSCDANSMADTGFDLRPTGGTRVFEANAEVRFPVSSWLEGVLFTDVGQAWGEESAELADLEFSPGVGIRFPSPVGPIRIDVAYRFRGGEALTVVTPQIRPFDASMDSPDARLLGGAIDWVPSGQLALLRPLVDFGVMDNRFQLHFSIGQAF
ncbi:MAG: BamA/TamA family outer membrane protein [Gemmatimonadetes bacterium]|nr:BamA/TamA family outer membrane protein [Gemmatimonadota bacterium]MDA1103085.1 BamA/TamA family outer membrane protein [Gemmatimonadota bacterium]